MAPPAVTGEAVAALVVITVRRAVLRGRLRLRASDDRRQPFDIAGAGDHRLRLRLRRLIWLRRRAVRLVLLRLMLRAALIVGIRLLAAVRLRLLARRIGRLLVVVVVVLLAAKVWLALCGLALRWLTLPGLGAIIIVVAFEGFVTNLARSRRRLVVGILRPELFLRGG